MIKYPINWVLSMISESYDPTVLFPAIGLKEPTSSLRMYYRSIKDVSEDTVEIVCYEVNKIKFFNQIFDRK